MLKWRHQLKDENSFNPDQDWPTVLKSSALNKLSFVIVKNFYGFEKNHVIFKNLQIFQRLSHGIFSTKEKFHILENDKLSVTWNRFKSNGL